MTAPVVGAAARVAAGGASASAGRAAAGSSATASRGASASRGAAGAPPPAAPSPAPQAEPSPAPAVGGKPKGKSTGKTFSGELGKKNQSTRDRVTTGAASVVHDGTGFILALLVWGWVVMPFLDGGAAGVKKVLMAKFLNKTPTGEMMP